MVKRKRGRSLNTVKYRNPFNNEPIGVYKYRLLHVTYKRFFNQYPYIINSSFKIENKEKKFRGRPFGSVKYFHPETKTPINVYEWRKTKEGRTIKNLKARPTNILRNIRKDSIKYNITFSELLELKNRCSVCGFDKWFCDIHHKDLNHKNNSKENLIGLCPTCHMGVHRRYLVLNDEGKYIINSKNKELLEIRISYLKK